MKEEILMDDPVADVRYIILAWRRTCMGVIALPSALYEARIKYTCSLFQSKASSRP